MQNLPSWAKFGMAVIVQVLLLGGLIFMHQIVLIGGQSVTLKVEPVDPRSPLRGDYVRLQYNISEIDSNLVVGNVDESETVYVVLEPQQSQDYWEVVRAYPDMPNEISQNRVVIRGKVEQDNRQLPRQLNMNSMTESNFQLASRINSSQPTAQYTPPENPPDRFDNYTRIELSYGIEEYYIPEGTGRNVDFSNKKVRAKVKVGPGGRAVLQQVFVDGEPWP